MKNRLTRINDELMKELSNIIRFDVKDPRICTMTSVIRVETTQDLKYCKVYISLAVTCKVVSAKLVIKVNSLVFEEISPLKKKTIVFP